MDHDFEKLGAFYLGGELDATSGERSGMLLLDARDLTTHGVIIGMTGSGKTGLGVGLIEEAAIDRIPVIAIDPKGDLPNLLLTFPDLAPSDFRPWLNEDVARQRGVDPDTYAAQQAESWRAGLALWGQDGERVRRLREHAEFSVYTPGSAAGIPVSVLRSFDAPPQASIDDADAFRERVQSSVTGLLGLLGVDADPVRSREHILLSTILDDAWRHGRSLDLGSLIQAIQQPTFTRLGVMELESFYPAKDRFALAMQLNALLASPGFRAWMEGEPLDIASLLYTQTGKPRVSIFSIAHLGDAERMFFVTMLLSAVLAWTRSQPGTTTLRALLYMDEVFGFFPPTANPPSKGPMLTLLKQARAYGLGVVVATQNPVDLDYKGLGNTGTWFIGRLQTDRDKARVLDALDGAMAGSNPVPRADLDRLISGLSQRTFLMHSVHRDAPTLFQTRWAMSYLAGPMTLAQIRTLDPASGATSADLAASAAPPPGAPPAPAPASARPLLPPDVRQFFVAPVARSEGLTYRPAVLGVAEARYAQARLGVDQSRSLQLLAPLDAGPIPFSAERVEAVDLPLDLLDGEPVAGAAYAALPAEATRARSYTLWSRELVRWIQSSQPIVVYESKEMKLVSNAGESERDFRIRLSERSREARDAQADHIRQRYESRFRTLQDRLRRAEQAATRRAAQSQQAILNTGVAVLGGLLGAMMGGNAKGQLGRASTAARGAGRVAQTRQENTMAGETVAAVRAQVDELEHELRAELHRLEDAPVGEAPLDEVAVRPNLNAISMRVVALAWLPYGPTGPLWK
ncbi:MAG: ATP-binding protein [Trueperaceae bacterium]|nr:ATP-binding protein [Trueperaceae bacterium]